MSSGGTYSIIYQIWNVLASCLQTQRYLKTGFSNARDLNVQPAGTDWLILVAVNRSVMKCMKFKCVYVNDLFRLQPLQNSVIPSEIV